MPLHELPNVLLLLLVQYLSTSEHNAMKRTCKRFHTLCGDVYPSILYGRNMTDKVFPFGNVHTAMFYKTRLTHNLLASVPRLQRLTLLWTPSDTLYLLSRLSDDCKGLRSLTLFCNPFSFAVLQCLPAQLTVLHLESSMRNPWSIMPLMQHLKDLESLEVGGSLTFGSEDILYVCKLKNLRRLSFIAKEIVQMDIDRMASALQLDTLTIHGNHAGCDLQTPFVGTTTHVFSGKRRVLATGSPGSVPFVTASSACCML